MPRLRVCDAAVTVLRRTGNPAVMWGDEGLLHLIADELGWPHEAWHTSDRVLNALYKTPGPLVKVDACLGGSNRRGVRFLPEEVTVCESDR
jgi:hypothetical protein